MNLSDQFNAWRAAQPKVDAYTAWKHDLVSTFYRSVTPSYREAMAHHFATTDPVLEQISRENAQPPRIYSGELPPR